MPQKTRVLLLWEVDLRQVRKPFSRFSNYEKYVCWHCRSCQNTKLKEDRLKALFGLNDEEIPQTLSKITVLDGALDVEFYGGRTEKWVCE